MVDQAGIMESPNFHLMDDKMLSSIEEISFSSSPNSPFVVEKEENGEEKSFIPTRRRSPMTPNRVFKTQADGSVSLVVLTSKSLLVQPSTSTTSTTTTEQEKQRRTSTMIDGLNKILSNGQLMEREPCLSGMKDSYAFLFEAQTIAATATLSTPSDDSMDSHMSSDERKLDFDEEEDMKEDGPSSTIVTTSRDSVSSSLSSTTRSSRSTTTSPAAAALMSPRGTRKTSQMIEGLSRLMSKPNFHEREPSLSNLNDSIETNLTAEEEPEERDSPNDDDNNNNKRDASTKSYACEDSETNTPKGHARRSIPRLSAIKLDPAVLVSPRTEQRRSQMIEGLSRKISITNLMEREPPLTDLNYEDATFEESENSDGMKIKKGRQQGRSSRITSQIMGLSRKLSSTSLALGSEPESMVTNDGSEHGSGHEDDNDDDAKSGSGSSADHHTTSSGFDSNDSSIELSANEDARNFQAAISSKAQPAAPEVVIVSRPISRSWARRSLPAVNEAITEEGTENEGESSHHTLSEEELSEEMLGALPGYQKSKSGEFSAEFSLSVNRRFNRPSLRSSRKGVLDSDAKTRPSLAPATKPGAVAVAPTVSRNRMSLDSVSSLGVRKKVSYLDSSSSVGFRNSVSYLDSTSSLDHNSQPARAARSTRPSLRSSRARLHSPYMDAEVKRRASSTGMAGSAAAALSPGAVPVSPSKESRSHSVDAGMSPHRAPRQTRQPLRSSGKEGRIGGPGGARTPGAVPVSSLPSPAQQSKGLAMADAGDSPAPRLTSFARSSEESKSEIEHMEEGQFPSMDHMEASTDRETRERQRVSREEMRMEDEDVDDDEEIGIRLDGDSSILGRIDHCISVGAVSVSDRGSIVRSLAPAPLAPQPRRVDSDTGWSIPFTILEAKALLTANPMKGKSWKTSRLIFLLFIVVVVSIAIGIIIPLVTKDNPEAVMTDDAPASEDTPDVVGDTPPGFEEILPKIESISALEDLRRTGSPQRKALTWLLVEDSFSEFSEHTEKELPDASVARYVLAVFYYSLEGQNWEKYRNWLYPGVSACGWEFVTCGDNATNETEFVTAIEIISRNNLAGALPSELQHLPGLQRLVLRQNSISGIVGKLGEHIVELDLVENNLEGSIPTGIYEMSALEYLRLEFNELTGTVSSEIASLTNLREFSVEQNKLEGPIPVELASLSSLEILDLSSNGFTGAFHEIIDQQRNLISINLSDMYGITGSIPTEIATFRDLNEIYLRGTQLSGPIPSELGLVSNLEYIYLSQARIDGPLPSELGQLTKLEFLTFHDLLISGSIPSEVGKLISLVTLDLSSCFFIEGIIPSEIGKLEKLRALDLDGTGLTGTLPSELSNLSNLESLKLRRAFVTGVVPSNVCLFPNIMEICVNEAHLGSNLVTQIACDCGEICNC